MSLTFNGAEWAEITYSEITKGMRILVVSEAARVSSSRAGKTATTFAVEGVVDTLDGGGSWWSDGVLIAAPDLDSTIYTVAGGTEPAVRRPITSGELFANIGATIERTETYEIIAAEPDSPIGWGYRDVRGAKTRYVVIAEAAEADPDASVLATIRESLDAADLNEVDEMSRRVLAGLRAAGVVADADHDERTTR